MNILAMDTSGPVCGVCVLQDQTIRCEITVQNKLTHSANLMPMIRQALESAGMQLETLDKLAVVTGPGSFTGVRIGVSTARGLAAGSGLRCVAVDALEALAAGTGAFDGLICPIQDARAGQVYGTAFTRKGPEEALTRLMADEPLKLEEFVEKARQLATENALPGRFLFTGDGMPVHREKLTTLLGGQAIYAPAPFAFLRPSVVAALAAEKEPVEGTDLLPFYLRPPSAEKNRRLLEAMQHV